MSGIVRCILICFVLQTRGQILDNRVILKVRQSIGKTLEYIEKEYKRVNEDCLFGVMLSTAIVLDAYKNGTHVMDPSSVNIVNKSMTILNKAMPYVKPERKWVTGSILDLKIWEKKIVYKYNTINTFFKSPKYGLLEKIRKYQTNELFLSNMDRCFNDIANKTLLMLPRKCFIDKKCWDIYYRDDDFSSGYLLTHKLLLLQLARGRNCTINKEAYENKITDLCSNIFSEVLTGDYFDTLDEMFDLFLEEILLCGYEGYTEFFSTKWLFYILKSQRSSGCFPGNLTDDLKSKIKRSTNIFEDGCADHTTGVGLAVLSLYYNFIIKEVFL